MLITSPRPPSKDLGKYYESDNYISHSNSSKSIFDKVYHISRHLALKWKLSIINTNSTTSTKKTILDYGCGTGEFLNACAANGFEIAGVEPSAAARKQATSKTKIEITDDLKKIESSFDVITLWHVLEHVEDLNEKISQLKSMLSKSGTMFIAVPNHQSTDAKHYRELWAGYDVPRHLWHFNERSMTTLLQNHGLTLHKIIPMKLDAFYVSMLSEKYRTGKQSLSTMIAGFWNGLKSNLSAGKNNYSSQIFVIRK